MRPRALLLATLALLALLHGTATAWTYGDTLTVIWKPLPNLPTILRPGDTLTVWAKTSSAATGFTASLRLGSLSWSLGAAGAAWQASLGWWTLAFRVPQDLPEEMYDLALACSTCPPDTARHAVKVIPAFKSAFYIAHITDTHVPSRVFSSDGGFSVSDTSGLADFNAVIDDLNLIHPEFILHTGDLVNEGELEEYLGMYEMGRAQAMIQRLRDPLFLMSGNHDIGGWDATPPPAGTARKNWWRYFGWPALGSPPAGFPYHSQVYSFDYGLLHVAGLEAYNNSGGYDDYLPAIYGANSMTQEEMDWLIADIDAVPQMHGRLAFIHYDFSSQFTNLSLLGVDGLVWGHNHSVSEGSLSARPFNLGLRSCIYSGSGTSGRAFRIIRVANGVMQPGPMHFAGGTTGAPTDSLAVAWSGPNDGTRAGLSATITNRFRERWDYARLVFHLADHDSNYTVSGGVIAQVIRTGGRVRVYVDCNVPSAGTLAVSVAPAAPVGVEPASATALRLNPLRPNPFRTGTLSLGFAMPRAGHARVSVHDLAGRLVATLFDGRAEAGEHTLTWSGRSDAGGPVGAGLYFVRLATAAGERLAKVVVAR